MSNKEQFIANLIKSMTLKEKIGQMIQYGRVNEDTVRIIKEGMVGSFLNCKGASYINSLQKIAVEETRLGIPLLFGDDVIHGFRTIFPIPLAESCSWDLELMRESARIAAIEANSEGINWIFAPMVDVTRDPRWGRIAEGAGEDHYLGKLVAKARVKGFQTIKEDGKPISASCPKHFIGYGAAIGGRDYNSCDISENYLRSYYLPPFKEAYAAGALTTMCSFNDLFSVPLSVNKKLLRNLLRDELKFKGIIVSDWQSIRETINHKVAENKKEAAYKALIATCDIDMHSGIYRDCLEELINENPELEKLIDEGVERILSVKYDLGLFDNPYVDENKASHVILSGSHRDHARKMASKSIVLLENKDNLLPLSDKKQKIALIGPFAGDKENHLGCWSWKGNKDDIIAIDEALRNNLKYTEIYIEQGCDFVNNDNNGINQAVKLAAECDIIILALGEPRSYSGEAHNRVNLNLPGLQEQLIAEIVKLHKPTIALISSGRPLILTDIKDKMDAILWTWHLGVEAGNAIYEVLFGINNPSGKLTVSLPKHVGQIPIYYNHKATGRPYAQKYVDCDDNPLYPFGYGLSYTNYTYENLKLKQDEINIDEELSFSIDVTNNGNITGEEVIQVYFNDHFGSTTTAVKQLCGFKKVEIKPHETVTVEFTIDTKEFGLYNENNQFVIEPGTFTLYVGTNSNDCLEAEFKIINK